MRHGKQTAAFFLAAAMVMSSSPAVVFAEELESGAEQEAAATGALAESELTSGEQETTEQTGEAILPEDNLLSRFRAGRNGKRNTAGQSRIRDYRNSYHQRVAGNNRRIMELGICGTGAEVCS